MCNDDLAISSIKIQEFNPEKLYEAETALKHGTIFSELNKTFFATDDLETTNHLDCKCPKDEIALYELSYISFVLDDLILFIDTHPSDTKALKMLNEYLDKKMTLLDDFAKNYYPLTRSTIPQSKDSTEHYNFLNGPVPWEGVCV